MNIAVISICILTYVLMGQPDWLQDGPLALRMATYHLYHANMFHLAVNVIATYTLFLPKHSDNMRCLVTGYVIASLVYPLSMQPCIGLSNLLYAVIGLRTPSFRNPWWRTAPVITFLAVTFSMLFIPNVAGMTHIVSFAAGIAAANILRLWRS